MEPSVGELPSKGRRAWTPDGLTAHGLKKIDIPPETGGIIIFQDAGDKTFAIQWDNGAITVHSVYDFGKGLVCIGTSKTLDEYLAGSQEDQS